MTQAEAEALTAKLFAAFPFHRDNDELTAAVYVEQIEKLPDTGIALAAINDLIATRRYLPVVADVREQYDMLREARMLRVKALNEAPPTPEEREQNARIAREFLDKMNAVFDDRAKAFTEPVSFAAQREGDAA